MAEQRKLAEGCEYIDSSPHNYFTDALGAVYLAERAPAFYFAPDPPPLESDSDRKSRGQRIATAIHAAIKEGKKVTITVVKNPANAREDAGKCSETIHAGETLCVSRCDSPTPGRWPVVFLADFCGSIWCHNIASWKTGPPGRRPVEPVVPQGYEPVVEDGVWAWRWPRKGERCIRPYMSAPIEAQFDHDGPEDKPWFIVKPMPAPSLREIAETRCAEIKAKVDKGETVFVRMCEKPVRFDGTPFGDEYDGRYAGQVGFVAQDWGYLLLAGAEFRAGRRFGVNGNNLHILTPAEIVEMCNGPSL